MVGWHHRLNGRKFEQTLGDSDGQGSLVCSSPWGRSQTRLSNITTLLSSFHNRLLLLYSYLIKNAKIRLLYISPMQFCHPPLLPLLSTATPSIRLQIPLAGMASTLPCLQSILCTLSTHDYLFNSSPLSLGIKS